VVFLGGVGREGRGRGVWLGEVGVGLEFLGVEVWFMEGCIPRCFGVEQDYATYIRQRMKI